MPERRVLYVTESDVFGGAERYLHYLMRGLDRSSFLPQVAAPPSAEWLTDQDPPRVDLVPVAGKGDLRGIRRQIRVLKNLRPDIVHLNLSNPLHGQFTMLAAEAAGVPVRIATMHLPPRASTPTWRGRALEALTLARLQCVIAVCCSSRDRMLRHFDLAPGATAVVHNGIDPEAFEREAGASCDAPQPGTRPLIGAFGRMTDQKGFDVLIEAAGRVAAGHPTASFVIGGSGPLLHDLKALAKRRGWAGRIHFPGPVRNAAAWLRTLDVFLMPSRYESFPFAILEAMASALPIVATDVDGIPEAVVHRRTGLLVPPEDAAGLASAILELIQAPQAAAQMGTAARSTLMQRFTAKRMVEQTEAIYHRCSA